MSSTPRRLLGLALFVAVFAAAVAAQSSDVTYPTPVTSDEITGRIAPRDLGDARLTRHFYTFNSTEGDLSVTVESTALDADVDLYTATGLRPLTKITLYAGASPTKVTKSVYLRTGEALILRVEGRSASDTEAAYRIQLAGAFQPASGAHASAPVPVVPTLPEATTSTRRVTSAGARVPEPPRPTPTPSAEETAASEDAATGSAPAATTTRRAARNTPARTTRGSAPRASRNTRSRPPRTTNEAGTAATGEGAAAAPSTRRGESAAAPAEPARRTERASMPRASRRSTPARRRAPTDVLAPSENPARPPEASSATGASAAVAVTATRLVIETKDGERIERDMNRVRRVTVENNQLVIVNRDGRVERQPMANILKMSIEP